MKNAVDTLRRAAGVVNRVSSLISNSSPRGCRQSAATAGAWHRGTAIPTYDDIADLDSYIDAALEGSQ